MRTPRVVVTSHTGIVETLWSTLSSVSVWSTASRTCCQVIVAASSDHSRSKHVVVLLGADRSPIAGQWSVNTATEYLVAVSALSPADRVQSLVAAAVTPSDCACAARSKGQLATTPAWPLLSSLPSRMFYRGPVCCLSVTALFRIRRFDAQPSLCFAARWWAALRCLCSYFSFSFLSLLLLFCMCVHLLPLLSLD